MIPNLEGLGIFQLEVPQRVMLAREILESIGAENPQFGLTDAQRQEIKRRLQYHAEHPEDVIPWETIERDLIARFGE